jgi:L-lactate dehydrogenase complex protein LldG
LEDRIAIFIERLADYDAYVHKVSEGAVAAVIGQVLSERNARRIAVPEGLPPEWLPQGFEFTTDYGLSYAEIDSMDGVLTECTAAIALTGTIILQDVPGQGRRALSLIPDYHLCVVRAVQMHETVPEAIRVLEATATRPTTTISGPSATSDIEMTRIRGVHGPRTLEIVLIV